MKETLIIILVTLLAKIEVQGKSMRVFINNAVVDAMDYLELDLITTDLGIKHGQTSDQVKLDIRVDDGNSSRKHIDVYVLRDPTHQQCYEEAVLLQDWTRNCSFLHNLDCIGCNMSQRVSVFHFNLTEMTKL